MAYSTSAPAFLIAGGLTSGVPRIFGVTSTDSTSTVDTAGFISNASDLGMKANDIVFHINTTNHAVTIFGVGSVTASSGADLFDGTQVGTTTNTD